MHNPTHQQVAKFFSLFGVDIEGTLRNAPDKVATFKSVQSRVEQDYKQRALTEHPDKGGDEEAFKRLTNARNCIQDMEIRPAPRLQLMPGIVVGFYGCTSTTTTTSTGTADTINLTGDWF